LLLKLLRRGTPGVPPAAEDRDGVQQLAVMPDSGAVFLEQLFDRSRIQKTQLCNSALAPC
jgi:hypothetical protein